MGGLLNEKKYEMLGYKPKSHTFLAFYYITNIPN